MFAGCARFSTFDTKWLRKDQGARLGDDTAARLGERLRGQKANACCWK